MHEFDSIVATIALSMGVAWASGIRLYVAIFVLGAGGATGYIHLPVALQILQDPLVIGVAAFMCFVEFVADKTPGVDSGWDGLQTFIRIPAGAVLAATALGDVSPALQVAAGLLGGTLTAATHFTKAGSRAMINTSPEPFSNWVASFTEDFAVLAGLWLALQHPAVFLVLLVAFVALMVWLLPKLVRAIVRVFRKLAGWIGKLTGTPGASAAPSSALREPTGARGSGSRPAV